MIKFLTDRLSLRIRIFLFFALIGVFSASAIFIAGWLIVRELAPDTVAPLVLYCGSAMFAILGVTAWVWLKFDENVAQPILTIINDMQAVAHAGSTQNLMPGTGKYLGFLAPSVDQVMNELSKARSGVSEEVQRATEDADRLKRRLETVVRDLQDGVVICRMDHTILLYNKEAQLLLSQGGDYSTGPGLGRKLTALLAEWPLSHSLDRLIMRYANKRYQTHPDGLMTPFSAVSNNGRETLMCRMSLMIDEDSETPHGYVVVLSNFTEELEAGVRRDKLIGETIREMRQILSNFSLTLDALHDIPELSDSEKKNLVEKSLNEREDMSRFLNGLEEMAGDLLAGAWPTSRIYSSTLFECVKHRLENSSEIEISHSGKKFWLECDSAGLVGLLGSLIEGIAAKTMTGSFELSVTVQDGQCYVDLNYEGSPMELDSLKPILGAPIDKSPKGISGFQVLERHKSEIWPDSINETRSRLRMPITVSKINGAKATGTVSSLPERPEFYDFELFSEGVQRKLEDSLLKSLSLVVFDTETTGLNPSKGDELVSIAGVRVVNGRVIRGEYFNRLVNPRRKIPVTSSEVHKITEEMVQNEPTIDVILPLFHSFVDGMVLLAHNAPFDMAFLEKNSGKAGVEFNQPVLDTVLLAAQAFGSTEDLTLDALMSRLSVELDERDRHTALGDSLATASVYIALTGILEQQGVRTLGDAIEVSRKQMAIRKKQAKY